MKYANRVRLSSQQASAEIHPEEDRVDLATFSMGGVGQSMIWMPNGNIYVFANGIVYRLEVEDA